MTTYRQICKTMESGLQKGNNIGYKTGGVTFRLHQSPLVRFQLYKFIQFLLQLLANLTYRVLSRHSEHGVLALQRSRIDGCTFFPKPLLSIILSLYWCIGLPGYIRDKLIQINVGCLQISSINDDLGDFLQCYVRTSKRRRQTATKSSG